MGVAFIRLDENNDIVDPHGVLACELVTVYETLMRLYLDKSGDTLRTWTSDEVLSNRKSKDMYKGR